MQDHAQEKQLVRRLVPTARYPESNRTTIHWNVVDFCTPELITYHILGFARNDLFAPHKNQSFSAAYEGISVATNTKYIRWSLQLEEPSVAPILSNDLIMVKFVFIMLPLSLLLLFQMLLYYYDSKSSRWKTRTEFASWKMLDLILCTTNTTARQWRQLRQSTEIICLDFFKC